MIMELSFKKKFLKWEEVIKNGLDDPYVHDMIEKELYVREQRRSIT